MFLLNNTNYKYSNSYVMIGLGLGGHFQKALDESGKETFTPRQSTYGFLRKFF